MHDSDDMSPAVPEAPAHLRLAEVRAFGHDAGRGNLLGIQPYMEPADYLSETAFAAKLGGYFAVAAEQGWLNTRTIVVLPEMTGTWLVIADEDPRVAQAPTISAAIHMVARRHPLALVARVPFAREKNRLLASIFRVKAQRMAMIYMRVFGALADTYEATIVAGSLVLPDPQVDQGIVRPGRGPLFNTSVVLGPNGKAHEKLVRKVVPIDREQRFVTPGRHEDLPVFDTPAGRLGVLIGVDSWFPALYKAVESQGAEMLAVPSYLAPDHVWEQPWGGYNGAAAPPDVDPAHVGQISEGDAWLRYAMPARLGDTGIAHGINVFLRGRLWDLGSDGHTLVRRGSRSHQASHQDGAALINCWLP